MRDAEAVAGVFDRAAEANLNNPQRNGSVIDLPADGKLLIAGDLHDHRVNFQKTIKLANLDSPKGVRHLVLQELIHSERLVNGIDLSYRTLVEAASMILDYPGRVHVLLSNHELSQVMGEDISKHGVSCCGAFDDGLDYVFGDDAEPVREAIARYVRSLPLAVRCANGVMLAHSLPSPRKRGTFDPTVLDRVPNDEELAGPNGDAHLVVWGRKITQDWADELAEAWGVKVFLLGHQAAEMGYETCGKTMMILESDHEHGMVVIFDTTKDYNRDQMVHCVYPLAAVILR